MLEHPDYYFVSGEIKGSNIDEVFGYDVSTDEGMVLEDDEKRKNNDYLNTSKDALFDCINKKNGKRK